MGDSYDYVIVGAGSAGCVIANRLSDDADATVLLIEAGGRDTHPFIHIPLAVGRMHRVPMFDWSYHSEPEPGLGGRSVETMRGKVLGGSSSINMTAHTRGDAGDYDRWAANGAEGWSYADVLPYFKRIETWEGGESEVRGGDGPVGVQYGRPRDAIYPAWLAAAQAMGFPENPDLNSGSTYGFGRGQCSIRDGRRSSSATAYLRPADGRPNLTVWTGVHAARVILEGKRAIGIEYDRGNRIPQRVHADREVILSGGTFNTPQLLMLSGIGPADHLATHGIPAVVDLPVGRNLQDHILTGSVYARKTPGEMHGQMRFDRMALNMLRAHFFGKGYASALPFGLVGFVRSGFDVTVPDIEFLFPTAPPDAHLWFPGVKKAYADSFGIRPVVLRPQSRGEVTLRSSEPHQPVRINFNFLSHPHDVERMRFGLKLARELAHQKPMDPFRGEELAPGGGVTTDAEIDAFVRRTMVSVHHPSSTCAMGSGTDSVVDTRLRVHGIDNLRVVDASVMPDIVSAHINACVLMIGERGADLIRGRSPAAPTPERPEPTGAAAVAAA